MNAAEVAALIVSLILSAGIITVLVRANIAEKHASETKKRAIEIVTPILAEIFGDDMTYNPGGRIGDEDLAEAQFVAGYNVIRGSDLVTSRYRGVPIQFSDVKLIQKVDRYNPKTKRYKAEYTTLFSGFWIVAEFDRELTAIPLNIEEGPSNDDIQTENVSFNKRFGIYCADRHAAFYVVTPHFMERLLEADAVTCGAIYIHLHKNKAQIAVDGGSDHFELEYFKTLTREEIEAKFRGEIREITNVLDRIMEHERLFGPLQSSPESAPEEPHTAVE